MTIDSWRIGSAKGKRGVDPALAAVIAVNALVCAYFLYLNFHTGWYIDDYGYMYVFTLDGKLSTQRVCSLADVARSQYAHYFLMNGRSVAHTLLQTALIGEKWLFNIINTLFYLGLGLACYAAVKPAGRHSPLAQIAVYALPWFVYPDYALVHLLACTAANYLWTMTIIIAFLLPFILLYRGRDIFRERKIAGAVVMALGGIIAGWCSENGSAAMLFAIGCMGLYYLIARKKIPAWCFSGFAGALCGFAMMLLSPGYRIRSEDAAESSAPITMYERFVKILIEHLLPYFWYIFAALICGLFVALVAKRADNSSRLRFALACCLITAESWLLLRVTDGFMLGSEKAPAVYGVTQLAIIAFLLAAILTVVFRTRGSIPAEPLVLIASGAMADIAMLKVPVFQTRSEWPFFVMALMLGGLELALPALVYLARTLFKKQSAERAARYAAAAAITAVMACSLTATAVHTRDFYEQYMECDRYMEYLARIGITELWLPRLEPPEDEKIVYAHPSDSSPDYWINQAIRQYYLDKYRDTLRFGQITESE